MCSEFFVLGSTELEIDVIEGEARENYPLMMGPARPRRVPVSPLACAARPPENRP